LVSSLLPHDRLSELKGVAVRLSEFDVVEGHVICVFHNCLQGEHQGVLATHPGAHVAVGVKDVRVSQVHVDMLGIFRLSIFTDGRILGARETTIFTHDEVREQLAVQLVVLRVRHHQDRLKVHVS